MGLDPRTGASDNQHPDDAAVDALAAKMKAKLAKQRAKGYKGWDSEECSHERLTQMLRSHVEKGDPVDVANFCAFLSARGEGIGKDDTVASWRTLALQFDNQRMQAIWHLKRLTARFGETTTAVENFSATSDAIAFLRDTRKPAEAPTEDAEFRMRSFNRFIRSDDTKNE